MWTAHTHRVAAVGAAHHFQACHVGDREPFVFVIKSLDLWRITFSSLRQSDLSIKTQLQFALLDIMKILGHALRTGCPPARKLQTQSTHCFLLNWHSLEENPCTFATSVPALNTEDSKLFVSHSSTVSVLGSALFLLTFDQLRDPVSLQPAAWSALPAPAFCYDCDT